MHIVKGRYKPSKIPCNTALWVKRTAEPIHIGRLTYAVDLHMAGLQMMQMAMRNNLLKPTTMILNADQSAASRTLNNMGLTLQLHP